MKHLARYILLLIVFLGCIGYCFAQNAKQQPREIVTDRPSPEYDSRSWKEFSSKEGRFDVLFPAAPTEQTQTIDSPFGKLDMHSFTLKTFAYYGVAYTDYPETNGIRDVKALFSGYRVGLLKSVNGELLEEQDDYRFENPGRYFKMRIPSGFINRTGVYLIRNRFYIISLTMPESSNAESTKFNEEVAAKFFNSFKPKHDNVKGGINLDPIVVKPLRLPTGEGITVDPDVSNGTKPEPFANVSGGILNGKATSLPKPEYPVEARTAGVSGEVKVKIVFDESGNVIWTKAVSGPQLLQAVAEEAASKAKFQPVTIQGKPVKVSGFLLYKFVH